MGQDFNELQIQGELLSPWLLQLPSPHMGKALARAWLETLPHNKILLSLWR